MDENLNQPITPPVFQEPPKKKKVGLITTVVIIVILAVITVVYFVFSEKSGDIYLNKETGGIQEEVISGTSINEHEDDAGLLNEIKIGSSVVSCCSGGEGAVNFVVDFVDGEQLVKGHHQDGDKGVVKDGPSPWDSRMPEIKNSWYVDYEDGVDGWCLENFLETE